MPPAFDQAVRDMCGEAISQAVSALAEKYGFDAEEANRFLDTPNLKLVRKRGPAPKKETGDKPAKAKPTAAKPKTKRPPTGYLLFAAAERPVAKEALSAELAEGEKLKPQATVTEIARRWKALSDEEQGLWKGVAKAAAEAAGVESE